MYPPAAVMRLNSSRSLGLWSLVNCLTCDIASMWKFYTLGDADCALAYNVYYVGYSETEASALLSPTFTI